LKTPFRNNSVLTETPMSLPPLPVAGLLSTSMSTRVGAEDPGLLCMTTGVPPIWVATTANGIGRLSSEVRLPFCSNLLAFWRICDSPLAGTIGRGGKDRTMRFSNASTVAAHALVTRRSSVRRWRGPERNGLAVLKDDMRGESARRPIGAFRLMMDHLPCEAG
jgi:hypothetical protein